MKDLVSDVGNIWFNVLTEKNRVKKWLIIQLKEILIPKVANGIQNLRSYCP